MIVLRSGVRYDFAHLNVFERDHVRNHRRDPLAHSWAASSDSKTTIPTPDSSFRVQYPATNPGACDTPGTMFSRRWFSAASWSLMATVTTTLHTSKPSFVAAFTDSNPISSGGGGFVSNVHSSSAACLAVTPRMRGFARPATCGRSYAEVPDPGLATLTARRVCEPRAGRIGGMRSPTP